MRLPQLRAWLIAATAIVATDSNLAAAGPADVDFNRDIRPILSETCYQCHGPDHNKRKADLRLDTRGRVVPVGRRLDRRRTRQAGREGLSRRSGSRLRGRRDLRMPPPKAGKRLTPVQIDRIKRWIEQGAVWKGHWAYIPPSWPDKTATLPSPATRSRAGPCRIAEAVLEPSPKADRPTLIRRLAST